MGKLQNYNGSIELISGITQKNRQDFPLVEANAVQVDEKGTRLNQALNALSESMETKEFKENAITEQNKQSEEMYPSIKAVWDFASNSAKLAPENPDGIPPYNIPMGYPGRDGSLLDSSIKIYDIVLNSSFNNNANKVVKVEKYTDADGKDAYHLVASSLSTDDIATIEQMELLNETTLTEDAVVMFNTDSSGNALALKKFELLVSLPTVTSATTIWIGINGHCMAYTQASSASAANPTYRIWGEYISVKNNWDFRSVMNSSNGTGIGSIYSFPNGNRYSGTLPSAAHGIIIAGNGALTTALPTGTKVTLWGVRE